MAELMREVAELPPERQNELAAFLPHLRLKRDPAWRAELTNRIDDKNPDHWGELGGLENKMIGMKVAGTEG
jgi:hypothetical protein